MMLPRLACTAVQADTARAREQMESSRLGEITRSRRSVITKTTERGDLTGTDVAALSRNPYTARDLDEVYYRVVVLRPYTVTFWGLARDFKRYYRLKPVPRVTELETRGIGFSRSALCLKHIVELAQWRGVKFR